MRLLSTTAIVFGAALLLSGCAAGAEPTSGPTANVPYTGAPRPAATAKPAPPAVFVPDGTAAQNMPFFVSVIEQAIAANPEVSSLDVAVLESQSGFDGAAIQYTFSRTAVGLVADSVSVAVLIGDQCIVAQFGPVINGVQGIVLPVLAQGGCLVGAQVQRL